jgi:hypothetical protein
VLDKNDNLLLVDQLDNVVDVIAPPYNSITSQISANQAFMVTINKRNDQIYVSDALGGVVYVDAYPSGSRIATLGASNGITEPYGVSDTENYVP